MTDSDQIVKVIEDIVKKISKIESDLEKSKEVIADYAFIKSQPQIYLKGKFVEFDENSRSLEILVNGERRFYSVDSYLSYRLPFPGSTVLIFSEQFSDGDTQKIVAIEKGEIVKECAMQKMTVKALKQGVARLYSREYGYIDVALPENCDKNQLPIGVEMAFKEICFGWKKILIPLYDAQSRHDRLVVLSEISRSINA